MNLGPRSYEIILRRGALQNLYQFANLNRRVAVVTDDGVPPLYARQVADQCREAAIITVPQGEASKSLKILESVLQQMLDAGLGRGDLVIARSEEHTSELQSRFDLVCRLLLEQKIDAVIV